MVLTKSNIEGLYIVEPRVFEDARGLFFETFNEQKYNEKDWNSTTICRRKHNLLRPINKTCDSIRIFTSFCINDMNSLL